MGNNMNITNENIIFSVHDRFLNYYAKYKEIQYKSDIFKVYNFC